MRWTIELRGGSYDGYGTVVNETPQPLIIVWYCGECSYGCEGHATFNPADPLIMLSRAQAYSLTEADEAEHHAIYEVGDLEPQAEDELNECVLAGAAKMMADYEDVRRNWEKYVKPVRPDDPLGAARGAVYGIGISVLLWVLGALPFVLGATGKGVL